MFWPALGPELEGIGSLDVRSSIEHERFRVSAAVYSGIRARAGSGSISSARGRETPAAC